MIDLGGDVTGNGISKLVFTILSAVFETERDRIRERIADVKSDQKTRGRFFGGSRPFGWQIAADGSLEPLEGERKALLAMRRMKKAGKKPAHDRDRNAGARVCNLTPGRQEGAGEMGRQVR
jgi:DNA invertase Pin-like site-specific DNA recombinase